MKTISLHTYQAASVDFALKIPNCALFLPMGAGKTLITLKVITSILEKTPKHRILIVAPLSVMRGTWIQEAEKWDDFKNLTFSTLHGDNKKDTYLNSNADIFLINYEGLKWLDELIKSTKRVRFNWAIFDESSKIKCSKTQRFKICKRICSSVDRVMLLSATPSPNHYLDLWSQFYVLDSGVRLGKTLSLYKAEYFVEEGHMYKTYLLRIGSKNKIISKLSDITYRVCESQLPKIPELEVNIIKFSLSNNIHKQYKDLEKKYFLEIDNSVVEALNPMSVMMKCRQLAQGFLYDSGTGEVINVHKEKLDILQNTIDGLYGEPTIVAYNFRHELKMILEHIDSDSMVHLETSNPDSSEIIKRWNSRKIEVLLCNPASVSHGLNLQKGGSNIIWFGLTFSWEQYTQLVGRLKRQGQESIVRNHVIIANNTVDELIFSKLSVKECSQQDFLKMLYDYRNKH